MRRVHVHIHRGTRDAALSPAQQKLAAQYRDLTARMWDALQELNGRTGDNAQAAWHEELHPRAPDGKFGHGERHAEGPMPAKKSGMAHIHELLSTGRPFTKQQLMEVTGLTDKRVSDYLAMLKNAKYAKPGVLNITRTKDGLIQVVTPDGKQAPPNPEPKPVTVTVTPRPAPAPTPAPTPAQPKTVKEAAEYMRQAAAAHGIKARVDMAPGGDSVRVYGTAPGAEFSPAEQVVLKETAIRAGLVGVRNTPINVAVPAPHSMHFWLPASTSAPVGIHVNPPTRTPAPYKGTPADAAGSLNAYGIANGMALNVQHTSEGRVVAVKRIGIFGGDQDFNYRRLVAFGKELGLQHVPGDPGVVTFQVPKPAAPPARKVPKGEWVPAKTAKEATARAVSEGWLEVADFGNMSAEAANEYMTSVADHFREFPALATDNPGFFVGTHAGYSKRLVARQAEVVTAALRARMPDATPEQIAHHLKVYVRAPRFSKKAWAMAWNTTHAHMARGQGRAVTINESFSKDTKHGKAELARGVESKFHPVGCDTYKSVMDHELGHQMDYLLGLRAHPDIQALQKEARGAGGPLGQVTHIKDNLSRYGATNSAEFIAEAWAEYRNNPNPRPIAARLGEIVKREYARKYGTA